MGKPEQISNAIKDIIKSTHVQHENIEHQIMNIWDECVGESIKRHTQLLKIEKKVLFVLVDTPQWMYEINTKYAANILKKVQDIIGKEHLKKILFKVGTM